MKQTFVADLKPETTVQSTFLVQSKERKIASNGNAYQIGRASCRERV